LRLQGATLEESRTTGFRVGDVLPPHNVIKSITLNQYLRGVGVSRASISFPPTQMVISFRQIVYWFFHRFNSTVLLARLNPHPAQRHYRAPSVSACRTVFASAAHRVVCQACPCHLVMLWLVPRLLWRRLLWVMNHWCSILVSGHLAVPWTMSWCCWPMQV